MITAAVLAAGASRRLGRPKQLVTFRGEPLVLRSVRVASEAVGPHRSAVVLGARAATIACVLPAYVPVIVNDAWREGIASSVRSAVAWAEGRGADALVLLLADQPLVTSFHVGRLLEAWRAGAPAVGTLYDRTIGAPALFGAGLFPLLGRLSGDVGAGRILRSHAGVVGVRLDDARVDVDVLEDLTRLQNRLV